ncbi:MAG TPA: hypothetical protein DEB09_05895 [Candidatus Magasanikbacteria bacterium]|nr:hypothetical protein [Candidatus Magasanikbacteria bacterium]
MVLLGLAHETNAFGQESFVSAPRGGMPSEADLRGGAIEALEACNGVIQVVGLASGDKESYSGNEELAKGRAALGLRALQSAKARGLYPYAEISGNQPEYTITGTGGDSGRGVVFKCTSNQVVNAPSVGGKDGEDGKNGLTCWDLNGDGICQNTAGPGIRNEDTDGDMTCSVLDCRGEDGDPGSSGSSNIKLGFASRIHGLLDNKDSGSKRTYVDYGISFEPYWLLSGDWLGLGVPLFVGVVGVSGETKVNWSLRADPHVFVRGGPASFFGRIGIGFDTGTIFNLSQVKHAYYGVTILASMKLGVVELLAGVAGGVDYEKWHGERLGSGYISGDLRLLFRF